ncbi:probable splicing factor, arginine/serine-rich 7 [Leptopilina boulardi]|uniref:probable splicing factor, arginine/serine-rich 7 n=1 Tax=Leptopilina boulardi TaxID=63433 RepID=UPI0021F530E3|nr:probable splicing factor, arginine/serine-rich 7 [Leptopilina boulardi]
MARYSSDSDSDRSSRHRRKNHRRSRSSSSDSSDSSSYKRKSSKHSKTKRRHRSRTRSRDRDRSSKSYKYSRDNSRDRERRRQKSRRSKSPSSSQKKQRRSVSREKSTSRSSSSQSIVKPLATEKIQNTIKDDFSIAPIIKESILEEINSEGFAPKQFSSSAQNKEIKSKNIVIDITSDTIVIPPVQPIIQSDSIFHQSIIGDQEAKFDKWVKKLYLIRQKAQYENIQ